MDFDRYKYEMQVDRFSYSPWYNGKWIEAQSPFRLSDGRFSLRNKPVCYLATDPTVRINYEINRCFENEKTDKVTISFERVIFQFQTNDFPFITTFYINFKEIFLFDLTTESKVEELAEQINEDKDILKSIISNRDNKAYDLSIQIAEQVEAKGFDGIIYKSCTKLVTDYLGPQNDPMVVLFNSRKVSEKPFS